MQTKLIKTMNFISYLTIFITFFTIGLFGMWLLYPYKTMELTEPIKVLNSPVKAGDNLKYEISYCNYGSNPKTISWAITNDVTINNPPVYSAPIPKGCRTSVQQSVVIPEFLDSGEYYASVVISEQVNPVRTIVVSYQTDTFQVVNNSK